MHFICDDKCIYKSIWQVYIIISLTSIYILGIFYYHHMMWDWWVHTKYPFFFLEQKKKKIKALCTFKKKKFSFKSAISLYFIWNRKEETDKIITYIDIHTHKFFFCSRHFIKLKSYFQLLSQLIWSCLLFLPILFLVFHHRYTLVSR